jgi:hypothetical protein
LDYSFEFADDLEQGKGPGPASNYTEPPEHKDREERLVVKRGDNRDTFTLVTKKAETLLMARVNNDSTRFDLFITRDNEPPKTLAPAFTLQLNQSRTQWVLESLRCELCESRGKRKCGTRVLARMAHYTETVGEGRAFCMDLDLPEVREDGSSAVVCPVCCGDAAGLSADASKAPLQQRVLTTRRPRWNPKHQSLTLDFRGRCSQASAKNFQLADPEAEGNVKLLFGKVGDNKFVLDYKYPLGMVQAFSAALTTVQWT